MRVKILSILILSLVVISTAQAVEDNLVKLQDDNGKSIRFEIVDKKTHVFDCISPAAGSSADLDHCHALGAFSNADIEYILGKDKIPYFPSTRLAAEETLSFTAGAAVATLIMYGINRYSGGTVLTVLNQPGPRESILNSTLKAVGVYIMGGTAGGATGLGIYSLTNRSESLEQFSTRNSIGDAIEKAADLSKPLIYETEETTFNEFRTYLIGNISALKE